MRNEKLVTIGSQERTKSLVFVIIAYVSLLLYCVSQLFDIIVGRIFGRFSVIGVVSSFG